MTERIKQKDIFLYHPTIELCSYEFGELLKQISQLPLVDRIIADVDENRYILLVEQKLDTYIITLRKLKNDELPKIADTKTGDNESNLEIPSDMSLSYKNLFAYNSKNNSLAMTIINLCPRISTLRKILEKIAKDKMDGCAKITLRFVMVFRKGLTEKLMQANSITTAEFRADDYYGDNIDETRLKKYKDYLSGNGYIKTTKLKGKRGQNIKKVVAPIIEDILSNNGQLLDGINIKMTIDGEKIDFTRYYQKNTVDVLLDENNKRYLDYSDLEKKLITIAKNDIIYEE
ncbi:hypothetical protein IKF03_03665 [Candidatus Saccharibacteria bacterium]|nr:hypothetical protein [Candidatus Saccharibacteria bacterium]